MGIGKIIGFSLIAILWFWLCTMLIKSAGGFNFKNVFLIVASGIIIFVPLWKKYYRSTKN